MQDETTLEDALAIMRDLRKRCEWDAAQSHDSMRPYLIEEAHELEDAIRSGDDQHTLEELGDVLLQVLFHSVIRSEEHTSELQSLAYLVCRLLLEKKKKKINIK